MNLESFQTSGNLSSSCIIMWNLPFNSYAAADFIIWVCFDSLKHIKIKKKKVFWNPVVKPFCINICSTEWSLFLTVDVQTCSCWAHAHTDSHRLMKGCFSFSFSPLYLSHCLPHALPSSSSASWLPTSVSRSLCPADREMMCFCPAETLLHSGQRLWGAIDGALTVFDCR